MPYRPTHDARRCAVVDLGSNSVRLVVYEGTGRNPVAIFNEKAVLRLGRGLQSTGRLNEQAVGDALTVMSRYHAIATAMGADPIEVLATAAVREADDGAAFVRAVRARMGAVPITILSGDEEALLSAEGVLCGIPNADGVLADIGGGSLELVELRSGRPMRSHSLKLGVLRLADRSGGDMARARAIVEAELSGISWLGAATGGDLFVVGGAWRALARIHMAQTAYPLTIVHHYTIRADEARDLASVLIASSRRALERLPGVPRRRIDDLPYAAVALRRLLRATGARRVVFSANGLREGWYMRRIAPEERAQDPLLAAAQDLGARLGRDPGLPPALIAWTAPLFPGESLDAARLRAAACLLSDIGSHDHPEYRAEQAFYRVLRQPGIALDHNARAFLALAMALRYEADPESEFLRPARLLLDIASARRAELLGVALRLAYTLCAGTPDLLAGVELRRDMQRLVLRLSDTGGVFAGESVQRRLDRVAQVIGLEGHIEVA